MKKTYIVLLPSGALHLNMPPASFTTYPMDGLVGDMEMSTACLSPISARCTAVKGVGSTTYVDLLTATLTCKNIVDPMVLTPSTGTVNMGVSTDGGALVFAHRGTGPS